LAGKLLALHPSICSTWLQHSRAACRTLLFVVPKRQADQLLHDNLPSMDSCPLQKVVVINDRPYKLLRMPTLLTIESCEHKSGCDSSESVPTTADYDFDYNFDYDFDY
jgi:hypothetical protein